MAQPRKTAADVLTENTCRLIRGYLEIALPSMRPEDQLCLHQVLTLYVNGYTDQPMGLAKAFEDFVADGGQYVRLRSTVEASAVRAFLEDYRQSPKHLAPRGNGWYLYENRRRQNQGQEG